MSVIDFNNAELQREGTGAAAVPEDSNVTFKLTIRPPKAGKEGSIHNLFCKSSKGNEYLDIEFEVVGGAFAGRKVWQNFTLAGSDQAAAISMRTLRAIIESARGVKPDDSSPQATAARQLSDWMDLNEMLFLAKVGVVVEQNQKDGKYYINNTIKKIITPDSDEYMRGEFITDKPLPALPAEGAAPPAAKTAAAAAPAWGAQAPAAAAAKSAGAPMPAWAAK